MSIQIIAEAGVNHNGSVELACRMADAAKDAGADYVKYQTFVPEKLVSKYAAKAEYQKQNTGTEESQLAMLQKLALGREDFKVIKEHCQRIGIGFLSTPFDSESIEFLDELGMDFWKIPSGEITNFPYLKQIALTGRKLVLSTGMCELSEIHQALGYIRKWSQAQIVLLHCTTEYPAPLPEVNLLAMQAMREEFQTAVGYSDHTKGIEIPIAAAGMGAVVIEKHFTLSRELEGPDHRASLEPDELKEMVRCIRNIECALGDGKKRRSPSEEKNVRAARKSIVAARYIKAGEILTEDAITTKRPGNGISPIYYDEILGTAAIRDFYTDELIEI